jgi:hypothetical protein
MSFSRQRKNPTTITSQGQMQSTEERAKAIDDLNTASTEIQPCSWLKREATITEMQAHRIQQWASGLVVGMPFEMKPCIASILVALRTSHPGAETFSDSKFMEIVRDKYTELALACHDRSEKIREIERDREAESIRQAQVIDAFDAHDAEEDQKREESNRRHQSRARRDRETSEDTTQKEEENVKTPKSPSVQVSEDEMTQAIKTQK